MERKAKKRLYEKALEGVRCVIHEWDPYSLLAGGAPKDEFDSEISAVVGQLGRIHSAEDACHVISRVFSSSFEPDLFRWNTAGLLASVCSMFLLSAKS